MGGAACGCRTGVPFETYAANPDAKFGPRTSAQRAFTAFIEHRLYSDLERGWRVTMPNPSRRRYYASSTSRCPRSQQILTCGHRARPACSMPMQANEKSCAR